MTKIETQAAKPVRVTGDVNKVDVPGLSTDDIKQAVMQFNGQPRDQVAGEIRQQKEVFSMLLEMDDAKGQKLAQSVGTDWPGLKGAIQDSVKETEALAVSIEKTGKLPVEEYGKLMNAVGIAAGLAFTADS